MKLNLRDLFWLTTVIGLGIANWQSRTAEHNLRGKVSDKADLLEVLKVELENFGMKISIDEATGSVEMSGPIPARPIIHIIRD